MKKWIAILGCIVIVVIIALFISTGSARTDVVVNSFDISPDEKTMTMQVGVTSSMGYIRDMKQTSGSMNPYLTFYSTFGINSKLGAKDEFEIELDENMDEIYFYTGNGGYKKVLEKDKGTGHWQIVRVYSEESALIKSLTPTGFAGSSFNKIDLYSNGDVYWIQYDGAGFDYENIVKNTLIATNATDIEMFEGEGINVIGNNVKSVEGLNLGWLMFNN